MIFMEAIDMVIEGINSGSSDDPHLTQTIVQDFPIAVEEPQEDVLSGLPAEQSPDAPEPEDVVAEESSLCFL